MDMLLHLPHTTILEKYHFGEGPKDISNFTEG
jgi:hypothetical protein